MSFVESPGAAFSNTYIILLISGLANNREDCVVKEQAHGENSRETKGFLSKQRHVKGGRRVAEVCIDTPGESLVHDDGYQSNIAKRASCVDLPEYRWVHKREEG